jgi:hypothetical protein
VERIAGMIVEVTSAQESCMSDEPLNPGDQTAPGTPGTGENSCPVCRGTGQVNGGECQNCGGTGVIVEGIGGA